MSELSPLRALVKRFEANELDKHSYIVERRRLIDAITSGAVELDEPEITEILPTRVVMPTHEPAVEPGADVVDGAAAITTKPFISVLLFAGIGLLLAGAWVFFQLSRQ